ncbi:hypothetical protein [Streptomyces armeniacus]|uniref:hypothetical protein n=1 Tax=Streptomyces armeniacus TaxID=83291 RepID=UPI001AD7EF08|nr:hypothetical protein [Streptomyces armeniacus]
MTRHRFEPARLVLGLLLLAAGLLYVLDAGGEPDVPTGVLLALVPAALVLGAVASLTTYGCRRFLAARRGEGRTAVGPRGERGPGSATASGSGSRSGSGSGPGSRSGTGAGAEELRDLPVAALREGYERARTPNPPDAEETAAEAEHTEPAGGAPPRDAARRPRPRPDPGPREDS